MQEIKNDRVTSKSIYALMKYVNTNLSDPNQREEKESARVFMSNELNQDELGKIADYFNDLVAEGNKKDLVIGAETALKINNWVGEKIKNNRELAILFTEAPVKSVSPELKGLK